MSAPTTIFIIGFMAAGKTALAKELAHRLALPAVDSDTEIEKHEGMPIIEIFKTRNESYFRNLEKNWIESLDLLPKVVSCGGGLPCFNDQILTLRTKGKVIYLNTYVETILLRLQHDTDRPLTEDKTREDLLALKKAREKYYQMAHETVLRSEEIMNNY